MVIKRKKNKRRFIIFLLALAVVTFMYIPYVFSDGLRSNHFSSIEEAIQVHYEEEDEIQVISDEPFNEEYLSVLFEVNNELVYSVLVDNSKDGRYSIVPASILSYCH